jgi:hypothetical protein
VAALWTRDIATKDICGQHDRKASVHASNDTCIFTASDYGKSFSLKSNPGKFDCTQVFHLSLFHIVSSAPDREFRTLPTTNKRSENPH